MSEAYFAAWLQLPTHEHERDTIAVLLAGEMESITQTGESSNTGSTVVEPAGERHACRFGPQGARVLVIQPDWRDPSLGCCKTLFRRRLSLRDRSVAAAAWRLARELREPDASTPLMVEGLAMEILGLGSRNAALHRDQAGPPRWLGRAEESLRADFLEPRCLRDLARDAGVHPVHLQRVFRARHGISIGAWQRQLRLEWAAQRLSSSGEPIIAIAIEAGFADQSHFTREFGRAYGCPPRQYRREQQR